MHNTFDVIEMTVEPNGDVLFKAISHNFPEISGTGPTEAAAIESMNRAIIYLSDNNKTKFKKRIKDRINKGLACLCGVPLNEPALAIYHGRVV